MPVPPKTPLIALMKLEAHHVAQVNKILAMAVNRLDQDIKALGKAGSNPLTLMQAKATRASLASFLGETFDDIEAQIGIGIKNAAAAASEVVSQYEDELFKLVMSTEAVNNLAKAEAQRAAAGINAAMQRVQGNSYKPLSQNVYNTKQMTLGWVDKRITQGLASGWSAAKLAGELKNMINPAVPGGVSYAAMRTARSEINNAFHASSAERYNNSPVILEVDWHLSSSHPEGDICDSLAADSPYPKKSVPQKPHPQCYCYITPHLPEPAKFVDNLFKGKYGQPPTGAAATVEQGVKAAGSKAAKVAAQNAMHTAIKTDPVPTPKTLGNQLGLGEQWGLENIGMETSYHAVQKLVNQMDATMKAWFKKQTPATQTNLINIADNEVDDMAAWMAKQAHAPAKAGDAWNPSPTVADFPDEDYDELMKYLDSGNIAVLKANNIDPEKTFHLVEGMDEEDFEAFGKILLNAEKPEGVKHLLAVYDLDDTSNSFSGALAQLSKGAPPKKVPTVASLSDEYPELADAIKLLEKHNMTADQIDAQLKKFSADQLAMVKNKTLTVNDQGYYIKSGTTPPHTSLPQPQKPTGAPTYKSIADLIDLDADDLVDSGATPEQIWFFLKGGQGTTGFEEIFKSLTEQQKVQYLTSAKFIDLGKLPDKDGWLKEHGFQAAKVNDVPVNPPKSYYTYADLEQEYGTPAYVWEGMGKTGDEIKQAIDWMDEYDSALQQKLMDAFDDYDVDALENVINQAIIKKKNPPIVDPPTVPKPPVPSAVPPPKELYDSYEDVADIFVKGNWKPNLLKNTGASPQQIADYVEGMNQAQYDHFMSLKWPSQKKHFEKLAANKADNAAAYEAKIEIAEGVALDASKMHKPLTSDPEVLARWRGKAQPGKPIEPKAPKGPGVQKEMDAWLKKVEAKYEAFAPGKKLSGSNNWSYVKKAMDGDLASADYLYNNKYLDYALRDEIDGIIKKSLAPSPADAAAYKKALEDYAKAKAKYDTDLVEWRAANGITSQAKGTWDGALVHEDNWEGLNWANTNLKTATGAPKEAIKKYSGSDYSSWNNALRMNADGNSVPSGSWGKWTREADQAMQGAPTDIVVRRGTGWDEFFFGGKRDRMVPPPPPNELIGTVQTNHGYISTSVGKTAAFSGQVQMRIRVPQGHPVTWVDPYSKNKGERELLLSRSTNMYIHDAYFDNGQWYVDAEIIPIGEDPTGWTPLQGRKTR